MKNTSTNKNEQDDKTIIMDMPEVKDIPGQEHVHPPLMQEMRDTTISSVDEEGEGLLDELNEDDEDLQDDATNVSPQEKKLLDESDRPVTDEDRDLATLALDEIDEDDVPNEKGQVLDMGSDLDIPGSDLDDDDEDLGEEDEENNSYSNPD